MKPNRGINGASGSGVAAAIVVLALTSACLTVPRVDRSPAGRHLSLEVSTVDGEPATLTASEEAATLVVIWASWCDSCPEVLGAARALLESSPGLLEVVTLSVDADPRMMARFAEQHAGGLRVLWDPEGVSAARGLALERVPTILLADETGDVRRVLLGWDRQVERAMTRSVEALAR